jgi:acyl-CoA thioesterase-1
MLRIVAFLLLLSSLNAQGAETPTVLIFGDSLSAGYGIDVDQSWAALLQSRLQTQGYEHRVINASISGETTRGFPPARMRANLEKIVRTSLDSGAAVVLLGIRIPTNYGSRYRSEFEAVFRELAETYDIPWIEFFMERVALQEELMQSDGIHPNAEAQPVLLDNAWPIISEALADGYVINSG